MNVITYTLVVINVMASLKSACLTRQKIVSKFFCDVSEAMKYVGYQRTVTVLGLMTWS